MDYQVECFRTYVETIRKDGKKVTFPVEVRRMHINGNFGFTKYFKVNCTKRKGLLFTVHFRQDRANKWTDEVTSKMVKFGSYTQETFTEWLGKCLGKLTADSAVTALLTVQPEKKVA